MDRLGLLEALLVVARLVALVLASLVVAPLQDVVTVAAQALVAVDMDVVVCGNKGALYQYFAQVLEAMTALVCDARPAAAHVEEVLLEERITTAECRVPVDRS
jgi:hypothetical protein